MMKVTMARLLCAGTLMVTPVLGHALTITDNANDFLPTFNGNVSTWADLDVISATVLYDAGTDLYRLTATMNASITQNADHLYVWGVNRGAGTAGFAGNGISGVLFDDVVLVNPDGTGSVASGGSLTAGSITISGATISAVVKGSLLPSTGFNKLDYTWNLWPRDISGTGFGQIADFAPDNSNFATTSGTVVPEPETYVLMLAGLGLVGWVARRRAVR